MAYTKHNKFQKFFAFTFTVFSLLQSVALAKLEQILLPINEQERKVTFTFYHFDSSKKATLTEIKINLGESVTSSNSIAAISASQNVNLTYQSGKFEFSKATDLFIKNKNLLAAPKSNGSHKNTLVLTDEKNRHALLYTPNVTEKELSYALRDYLSKSNIKYSSAIIINTGNQCGFYKKNANYNPYYLKELKKPAKALVIK